jgi:hypothetical protein
VIKCNFFSGNNQEWEEYVHAIGERWSKTIVKWYGLAHRLNYSILIVRYENVKEDSLKQVARMLDFLHFDHRLAELPAGDFTDVQRKHREEYEHYTESQKEFVSSMIISTMNTLELMGVDHKVLGLKEYLSSA